MKNAKRRLILGTGCLILGEQWSKPVVRTLVLPAHAQTSPCGATTWIFDISYLEFSENASSKCEGIYNPIVPTTTERKIFCLTAEEIDRGLFYRDKDLSPNKGPAADYITIKYTILSTSPSILSGEVCSVDVDTFYSAKGTWQATVND